MAKPRKRASKRTKKKTAARKRKSTKRSGRRSVLRISLITLLIGIVLASLYGAYLDYMIRDQFEGKRWSLPARVYARPLEIYSGLALARSELVSELKLLRYRPVKTARETGTYAVKGNQVKLVARQFSFWDGSEPERRIRIRIADGVVQHITDLDKRQEVSLLRLDPVLFASIYPAHNEDRILVRLDQVPQNLIYALLAVEDRNFYQHAGVDFKAILRALWANVRAGHTVQGASTLTQQLVKNYFLTNRRSIVRKLNEAAMAMLLESHYDKDEILAAYLNEVYLGQQGQRAVHGFGLASRFYFQRSLKRLSLQQVALLVGLVKGASYYDPRRFPDRARKRRNLVLKLMAQQGHITTAQASAAKQKPLGVSVITPGSISRYPAFLDLVRRQLRRDYRDEDLMSEGLRIFTTFDPLIQARAEKDFRQSLDQLEKQHSIEADQLQGAAIITDVQQGEIVAVIGGRDPKFAGFNRALDAIRQVGS
ncbi:MAG TPA: penicillin-binding protein 1B, partial [Gammaproteobacteria bacterium]|nr:penicillin-binding protein 1B [Gammaproteobacteria bacterium]